MLPSLDKLSTSRMAPVGTNPPSPKQSNATTTSTNRLRDLPDDLLVDIVLKLVANDPAGACVEMARVCATSKETCNDTLYERAMRVLEMPLGTLLDTSSWKERFDVANHAPWYNP